MDSLDLYNLSGDASGKPITEVEVQDMINGSLSNVRVPMQIQQGSVESGNFVSGSTGWKLGVDGIIEATQIKVGSLFFTKQFVMSFFESTSGWAVTAGVTSAIGGTAMQTSTTINTTRSLKAQPFGTVNSINFTSKNPVFTCGLVFDHNTAQTIRFGMGEMEDGFPVNGLGFKNVDGTVSAMSNNAGTETLTTITGIAVDTYNVYRVVLNSVSQVAYYYVNDVLVATHTTNIPTGTEPTTMSFVIKNTEAVNKAMYLSFASFQQDR